MAGGKFKWISGLKRIFVKYPTELKEEVEIPTEIKEGTVTLPIDPELKNPFSENSTLAELEQLKQKIDFLEKKIQQHNTITKQLIETVLEVVEDHQTPSNSQNDVSPTVEQKLQELRKKYDAILDILADKFAENETLTLPNLFVGDVSLRELWRKHPNHKDVLLYSIAYMMKKEFEEKGVKLR
jgi:hypothetical protein